jgi:hypothetical protein
LSIEANEVSCVLGDITFSEQKVTLNKTWYEVYLEYIDVLSLKCGKYAKELSIGANEIFSVSEDEIHIYSS